jgi:glutathione S-transferase
MATTTNGTAANGDAPKITLYTNHGCPWAHRVHITLKELGLAHEEVIIDLAVPRPEWYLKINPVRAFRVALARIPNVAD